MSLRSESKSLNALSKVGLDGQAGLLRMALLLVFGSMNL
jgi:hypothetical protein